MPATTGCQTELHTFTTRQSGRVGEKSQYHQPRDPATHKKEPEMRRPVLYAFVFLGVYLSYRVLSPFFVALTWAVLLAILFRGMQTALARRTEIGRASCRERV